MLTSYNNRSVGSHQHEFEEKHSDPSGKYLACKTCGFRRHKRANAGIAPYRPWWVEGAPWERGTSLTNGLSRSDAGHKIDAAVRDDPPKRGWPKGRPRKRQLTPAKEAP